MTRNPGKQDGDRLQPQHPHTLVWLDIPVTDLDRAIAFYSQVLSRPLDDYRPGQPMAVFHSPGGAVSAALLKTEDALPGAEGPLPYLNCAGRLKQAVSQVRLNGGRVVRDIHGMEPFGQRAIVIDSEGNRVALHSPEPSA